MNDDEGDSHHLLSTNYVLSPKLGSLPILNHSVHCNHSPLARDEMEPVHKKAFASENIGLE